MTAADTGCFGKLPIFADFIRHNASGPELQELDQWLQEGIYLARQSFGDVWSDEFDRSPAVRYIYRPGDGPRFLLGVSVPGTDKAGRRFPFTIFRTLAAAEHERDLAALPALFEPFLGASRALAGSGWDGLDVKALIERLSGLPGADGQAAGRGGYDDFLRGPDGGSFWGRLRDGDGDVGRYVLLQNLADARAMWKGLPSARGMVGLKFPLPAEAGEAGAATFASFWLDVAERVFGPFGVPPLCYWTVDGECPALFLYLGRTSPQHMLPMIRPAYDSDHLFDLSSGGEDRAAAMRQRAGVTPGGDGSTVSRQIDWIVSAVGN